MSRIKRIAVIVVLFVFLVNTMGYYVIFKCNECLVKKEMRLQIRGGFFHANMVLLKIVHPEKEKNFRRIEKSEFTWFGKLYDVVVERKTGDTTLIYCIHDQRQDDLIADFTMYLRSSGRQSSSPKDNPIPALLHNLITQALIQNTTLPLPGEATRFVFPVSTSLIIPVYMVHVAPPPESA